MALQTVTTPPQPPGDLKRQPRVSGAAESVQADREELEALRRSNAALSRFAAETAHDLAEPLRMVTAYLQLIERRYGEDLDDDGREFLEYAVDGATRMRATIDAQLEAARLEEDASSESIDVNEVLDDVLDDLAIAIEESGATVTAGELPTVEGHPSQLRRLLQNLVENAIDHAGTSAPTIAIDAAGRADEWVFEVADDGVGIPSDRIERVFEPFDRVEQGGGTGLGLAICEAIVDRHGGRLWVESEPGDGSTFYFSIPR